MLRSNQLSYVARKGWHLSERNFGRQVKSRGGNLDFDTHANKLSLLRPQQSLGLLEGDQTLLDPMALGNLDDDALLG